MLSDDEFIDRFIRESSRRLAKRHKILTNGLSQLGIGSLKSNAGLFFGMDLRWLLKEPTYEAEMTLWRMIIKDVKLNVSPGSSFHCTEPGWFRVCFANMNGETMELALRRIKVFIKKQMMRRSNLGLSFSSRRFEECAMTPRMMGSPHSPLVMTPHSPLCSSLVCGGHVHMTSGVMPHKFPLAMDVLLAEFHKACIYTVPEHFIYSKYTLSGEAYYKRMGYKEDEGKLENTESYLACMASYMRLYGALVQVGSYIQVDGQ
ncbi:hypothetical protein GIB67_003714 [Kingdonia uniflora]|uniref:1-aminocyclopropane-1-carboxylate synthase n=1 Tax=Kingdonia uniflora TaxID=39325 RepID=A0A7J7M3Y9_9MAGN|nr:hypothetical protein GIB67_003714 [Kingdonia uniflora]